MRGIISNATAKPFMVGVVSILLGAGLVDVIRITIRPGLNRVSTIPTDI
jgi:hypothetical protein